MRMRVKNGPLLVVGTLVVLVGLAVLLSPAPPPSDKNGEGEEAKEAGHKKAAPTEKPLVKLDDIKKLIASGDPKVTAEGIKKLSETVTAARGPEAAELKRYVVSLTNRSNSEDVRAAAVDLLRGIKDVDAALIINLAKSDPSARVRNEAVLALAKFTMPEAQATLKQLANDPDPGIRKMAIIAYTQSLSMSGKAGQAELASLLGVSDNDASAKAVLELIARGPSALPMLTDTLYKGQSGPQRQAAALAIAMICAGYNDSIDAFARAAQVTHRVDAGHQPANLAGLTPLLWALKNDTYAPTREVAAQGLGYLGDTRAAKPLAAALKDPDPYVRRRAAAALITVSAASVVPELSTAATTDTAPEVRGFAVEALGWVGTATVLPALMQATRDTSADVRRNAATQLGRIANPQALEALAKLLGGKPGDTPDPDPDVRWAAVVALGKLRDDRAKPALIKSLSDASPQVSNSAERALQKLGVFRQEKEGFRS